MTNTNDLGTPATAGQVSLLDPALETQPALLGEFRAPAPETPRYIIVESPIGDMLLLGDGEHLTGLHMLSPHHAEPAIGEHWREDTNGFDATRAQLRSYFAGELRMFDLPLAPHGTDFQRQVWRALAAIPYGQTATYGAIAARLGRPGASRAVGMANGRNPISVIVPCHRVIGANGKLVGYGGGLQRKQHLLALERG